MLEHFLVRDFYISGLMLTTVVRMEVLWNMVATGERHTTLCTGRRGTIGISPRHSPTHIGFYTPTITSWQPPLEQMGFGFRMLDCRSQSAFCANLTA